MRFVRFLMRLVIGFAFGIATMLALSPALASFTPVDPDSGYAASITLIAIAAVSALCAFAPSIRRAFGRGFLTLGAAVFFLPLSAMLLSGAAFSEVVGTASDTDIGMAAVGAGLAGGAITAAAAIVGFILGTIFLITGLVLSLGGRREVVIYDQERGRRRPIDTDTSGASVRTEPPVTR